MSTAHSTAQITDAPETGSHDEVDTVAGLPAELTVRASHGLHGFVAAGATGAAIGFAWSAGAGDGGLGGTLRWIAAAGFAVLALTFARGLLAGPLLIADDTGIRLRIHDEWIGTPWDEIEQVTVLPRRHALDDGRIAVHLEDPGPVVAGMSSTVRKQTDANRRLTGSSLAVPFGLAARPSALDVVAVLRGLADGRCPVTEQP